MIDDVEQLEIRKLYLDLCSKLYGQFQFAIITALPKERAAVLAALDKPQRLHHQFSDVIYYSGELPGAQGHHSVIVAQSARMGNSASAIAATALIKDFRHVTDVVMVGIAGAVPDLARADKDVRVGDIVVSHGAGLVQYDLTKIESNRIIVRSEAPKPSARLGAAVDLLETLRVSGNVPTWHADIDRCTRSVKGGVRPDDARDKFSGKRSYAEADFSERELGRPLVHYGIIGTANSLVKNQVLRDELRDQFGVKAIEMEGSGVADAAWFSSVDYLIVRGTCDYCDGDKDDTWQLYAACVAAGYVRSLFSVIATGKRS
ncbi:5'-methylthioadenosine/S-adenosylhomocysteine nucleosidase [Tardiphaga sp. 1201_B9_N1_1]|uniref:5'-methylthioadenosine/S-adenosylhomocysteine nucleosidase n=1 Tax=Tardiphaga sp. 1201_B9_N1_1 TaxID=3240377 RepID=UPI003F22EB83